MEGVAHRYEQTMNIVPDSMEALTVENPEAANQSRYILNYAKGVPL